MLKDAHVELLLRLPDGHDRLVQLRVDSDGGVGCRGRGGGDGIRGRRGSRGSLAAHGRRRRGAGSCNLRGCGDRWRCPRVAWGSVGGEAWRAREALPVELVPRLGGPEEPLPHERVVRDRERPRDELDRHREVHAALEGQQDVDEAAHEDLLRRLRRLLRLEVKVRRLFVLGRARVAAAAEEGREGVRRVGDPDLRLVVCCLDLHVAVGRYGVIRFPPFYNEQPGRTFGVMTCDHSAYLSHGRERGVASEQLQSDELSSSPLVTHVATLITTKSARTSMTTFSSLKSTRVLMPRTATRAAKRELRGTGKFPPPARE